MLNWAVNKSITECMPHQEYPTPPEVSAVIVSWNVRELLLRCIDTLQWSAAHGGICIETIVVDNASSDGSAEAARGMPGVMVLPNDENVGYGRANNQGLSLARGRYLLVLNPDTEVQADALATLVTFADSHPRAGIVAPRLLNRDGSVQSAAFRFPTLLMAALDLFPLPTWVPGRIRLWLASSRLNGRYPVAQRANEPFCIDHPLGACMLLRRAAYAQCGGFDPAVFMYSEEIDLAMRYASAGWECWQVPQARVVHLGGASTRQLPTHMLVELWRSRLYIYRKHRSNAAYVALALLLVFAQATRVLATALSAATGRITRASAAEQVRQARKLARLVLGG
jgi:N-acetylglucosaminyl-diphospho-decaprenol L-rhamnosyltransferase